ncbi:serine/threonine-protein kinase [Streptomyces sp. NBC_01089]|uniref:serine/threonine-protein kinase n=1 Tax=Streptomyces sp. NBC_01089 TaxID=2903747 RepID=UPI003868AD8A|nr:serine/threonine protein kinase [Streptomyces sp. NBC_01089]
MEHTHSADLVLAGRYRLGELIGRGGMGKVWRAHDEVLHRTVAVKELTAGLYVSEADRAVLHARTQKEARAAARINHPGVVTVHDVIEFDDRPWIVMEYVDGPSLADVVKESGALDPREAARVGLHVLGALRAAHAAGVLHRDVKPGNVLLAHDSRVLITDFGIAAIEGDSEITRTGEIVGSIDYLAPERVYGEEPGPASDLWSLGATLFTAVEERSPFRRTSPISTLQAVVNDEPPKLTRAGPLTPVITGLLRKDPDERPGPAEAERMLLDAMEGRKPRQAEAYVPTQLVSEGMLQDATPTSRISSPGTSVTQAAAPGQEELSARTGEQIPAYGSAQIPEQAAAQIPAQGAAPLPAPAPVPASVPAPGPGVDGTVPHAPEGPESPRSPKGSRGRKRRRVRTGALILALAVLVGAGVGFGVMKYENRQGSGGGTAAGSGGTDAGGTDGGVKNKPHGGIPAGWHRVNEPEGFSLVLPNGWKRQMDGSNEIDYTPDDGNHFIRISIDKDPDYSTPYLHQLALEPQLKRLPDYRRITLHVNNFRDEDAALWEFTWTETKGHPGRRRAIDQMYNVNHGQAEYAIYMGGPARDWDRSRFDTILRYWQPPA